MDDNNEITIVDENDIVIGFKIRSECHNRPNPPIHREVHVLVFNSKNEILLQQRSMTKETFPGYWTNSATGHVDKGETYETSAIRELNEELGIDTDKIEPIFKFLSDLKDINRAFIQVFKCTFDGPFKYNKEEVDKIEFYSTESLLRLKPKLTYSCDLILRKIGFSQLIISKIK